MNDSDLSRIKAFRQLKSEIRGSDRHLIVGVDIAKSKHHAFLGTANGKVVLKGMSFDNSQQGLDKLLTRVQYYMDRDGYNDAGGTSMTRVGRDAGGTSMILCFN